LIGACAATGCLQWNTRRLLRYAVVTGVLAAAIVGGVRAIGNILAPPAAMSDVLGAMSLTVRGDAVLLDSAPARDPAGPPAPGSRLQVITARRSLRVCYLDDALPYAYTNGRGELVGYDVGAMHHLAIELGIRLEFLEIARSRALGPEGIITMLADGTCDILAGGVVVTTVRAGLIQFSSPYVDETLGFVVPDARREDFQSWDDIRRLGRIRIAGPSGPYYASKVADRLPRATLVAVDSMAEMFRMTDIDALVMPAERGSAWTMRYPQYSAVVPLPDPIRIPLAFGMPLGEPELAGFINAWIELKRHDGTFDELYQYWILGKNATTTPPRWSIIRDVLHWVD
jgi:ABC-type amino acid transport substrate-binding protein